MRKKTSKIVLIVSMVVFIAAVMGIIIYFLNQRRLQAEYERLAEEARAVAESTVRTTEAPSQEADEGTSAAETTASGVTIPLDFDVLHEYNPDIYAWLTIPDTEIDYPVLKSPEDDPDYYLETTAGGAYGFPGAIYTQTDHNKDIDSDKVTVIYGHRTHYGGMFGRLGDYFDQDFRDSHKEIIIYTEAHIYHYKVFAAVTFDDRNILYTYDDCRSEADYQALLDAISNEKLLPSWVSDPFEGTTDRQMIILSTCNNIGDQRVLICAFLEDRE